MPRYFKRRDGRDARPTEDTKKDAPSLDEASAMMSMDRQGLKGSGVQRFWPLHAAIIHHVAEATWKPLDHQRRSFMLLAEDRLSMRVR